MQCIYVCLLLHELLQQPEHLPQIIELISFWTQNQEVFFILLKVIFSAGSHDYHPSCILIDLYRVLQVIVILNFTKPSMGFWKLWVQLQLYKNSVSHIGRETRIEKNLSVFDAIHARNEITYFVEGEQRPIVITQTPYSAKHFCNETFLPLNVEWKASRWQSILILHKKAIYFKSDDYFRLGHDRRDSSRHFLHLPTTLNFPIQKQSNHEYYHEWSHPWTIFLYSLCLSWHIKTNIMKIPFFTHSSFITKAISR